MQKKSAGILLYRLKDSELEVLLVHPGGPFWSKKDIGAWSIPKGEFTEGEEPLEAAKREFKEETGVEISGEFLPLSPVKLKSGKVVYAFAIENEFDICKLKSNTFKIEWPPKSGKEKEFPEIDKAEWMNIATAIQKINASQIPLIEELVRLTVNR